MEEVRPEIFSVSEFIRILNIGLKRSRVKIIGEVSEVKFPLSGHVYFTLKDEKDGSIIKSIIWKGRYSAYGIKLEQGLKIIASGYPEVYPATGGLSFIAETIEHAGEGKLRKEYEALKKKLEQEGLFEISRKRSIPQYIQKIGVVTSTKGAVIHDFSSNLEKFGFKIKIINSLVSGQAAVIDLLSSVKAFKKQEIDILVIMRGGGSLEDMQAFNNETLVREIANFPVPVIAGIGHDKDEPLVSLVADKSVSTPTAITTLLNQPWKEAKFILEEKEKSILSGYSCLIERANLKIKEVNDIIYTFANLIIDKYKTAENNLKISLQNFKNSLSNKKLFLKELSNKYLIEFKRLLLRVDQKLEEENKIIQSYNPERQFKLGYSIIRNKGKIVKTIKDVKVGEEIDIKIIDGLISSKVNNINKLNNQ
jgi:exodeoxyribonuclease VII large subunit